MIKSGVFLRPSLIHDPATHTAASSIGKLPETGFTLIEMSVVLIIVALVTGMAMSSGVAALSSARYNATVQKMAAIDQALLAYRNTYDRLPCPGSFNILAGATNYGVEAGGGMSCTTGSGVGSGVCSGTLGIAIGTCPAGTALVPAVSSSYVASGVNTISTAAEGTVPTVTLKLPNDFMFDGWGRKFRYAVDINATTAGIFNTMPLSCAVGAITVYDASGTTARTTDALYALISHGANGHGAYANSTSMYNAGSQNANEQINCHCSSTAAANSYVPTYVQADPTNATAGNASTAFDDLVTYRERWQLQNGSDLVGAGCIPNGILFVADYGNNAIRKVVLSTGIITTVAGNGTAGYNGDGIPATNAMLNGPENVAIDSAGNLYIADEGNSRIRKVSPGGIIITIAGNGTAGYNGDGIAATSAELNFPSGIALDSANNIYIADTGNYRVRKITTNTGLISTIAGNGTQGYTNGTATSSEFEFPVTVALDSSGNIYVADGFNGSVGSTVRKITGTTMALYAGTGVTGYNTTSGTATSVKLNAPLGITLDGSGTLYIPDNQNDMVREVTSTGTLTTIAGTGVWGYSGDGGAATSAKLAQPSGAALDTSGNIYISDTNNGSIRKITASTGVINTIAGYGTEGYSGDGGQATSATLFNPGGLVITR